MNKEEKKYILRDGLGTVSPRYIKAIRPKRFSQIESIRGRSRLINALQLQQDINEQETISQQEIAEHEKTRRYLSDRFDELAKKDDLLKAKDEIINKIVSENKENKLLIENLNENITDLQDMLIRFLPHKRLFKISLSFFIFFTISLLSNYFLNTIIIVTPWSWFGFLFSFGFILMSYFLRRDWNK